MADRLGGVGIEVLGLADQGGEFVVGGVDVRDTGLPEELTSRALERAFARTIAFYLSGERAARGCFLVGTALAEAAELLPRYRGDNVFDTAKFTSRFPDFAVTTYDAGVAQLVTY